ncbi:hypothetical protein VRY54_05430 [Actinomyces sp. F1_1611]
MSIPLSGGATGSTGPGSKPSNRPRRTRVDRITTMWMILAALILAYSFVFRGQLNQQWWTTVHLITLGVITNAILQWSWYFSRSLLRLPPSDKHSGAHQTARQVLFNLALVELVAAMWLASPVGAVIGATAIGLIVAWHVVALVLAGRSALAARFAVIIRYYTASGAFLVVGTIYASLLTIVLLSPNPPAELVRLQGGLTVAHALVNGLGWVGLTIAGTLVTLGPTALRTRMADGAVTRAVQILPVLIAALLVATVAATFGLLALAGLAILVYAAALVWGIGMPLLQVAVRKPLAEYASWNFAAGILWFAVGLVWLAAELAWAPGADTFRESSRLVVGILGVGGVLQILIGALSYLLPVVVGGGPTPVRVGNTTLQVAGGLRLAVRNAGLLLAAFAGLSGVESTLLTGIWAGLIIVSFLGDIAAMGAAGVRQAKAKREPTHEGGIRG